MDRLDWQYLSVGMTGKLFNTNADLSFPGLLGFHTDHEDGTTVNATEEAALQFFLVALVSRVSRLVRCVQLSFVFTGRRVQANDPSFQRL